MRWELLPRLSRRGAALLLMGTLAPSGLTKKSERLLRLSPA